MPTKSVAIVTGASQGIGRATAIRVARDFQAVVLAGVARYGEPEEIAGLMAYLVSKEARWLTGASVRMDGGEVKGI
jgi:NAD(P)-dependent dehydrogenase (short-subunit alcohol dehydrogenase family)